MGQRKLGKTGLRHVEEAKVALFYMCDWLDTAKGLDYWVDVKRELNNMLAHGTTDGKPYVEPQPEIPEGYRLAVAGDQTRRDIKFWYEEESKWFDREPQDFNSDFLSSRIYIVPINPQPEIGDGYRVATDDATDRGRYDREGWVDGEWKRAGVGHTIGGIVYRVPIDVIPTDEQARERPLVMVRDNDTSKWAQKRLIAVSRHPDFPFVVIKDECHSAWRYCRFPYPGE